MINREKKMVISICIEMIFFLVYILFDDVFELNDDEKMVLNSFVKLFVFLMNEVVRCVFFFWLIFYL